MKKSISLFLLAILILQSLALSSCAKKNKYTSYSFDHFDTVTTLVGYEKDQKTFDEVSKSIMEELEEYHKLFDIYNSFIGMWVL